jgi:hypothetical protein
VTSVGAFEEQGLLESIAKDLDPVLSALRREPAPARPSYQMTRSPVLLGLGVAIVTPSTTALVVDLVKAGRMGSAMGGCSTIWDSGEARGSILAGFLIGSLGCFPAFALIALLVAAVALSFATLARDPRLAMDSRA